MHFERLFFQVYITEEVCVITLKCDTIFKEKLTGGLKNDIKNLVNFHGSSRMWENLHFDGFLLSTAYKVSWKSAKELSLMTLKKDQNFLKKWLFVWKNDMRNLVNFREGIWWILTGAVESQICTLMGYFLVKST